VHRPELVLGAGRLGGLGGELRVGMRRGQREMPKDEAQAVLEFLQQHFHRRIGLAAGRAFEVAVFHEDDFRRFRAHDVVGLVDGYCELWGFGVSVHEASEVKEEWQSVSGISPLNIRSRKMLV